MHTTRYPLAHRIRVPQPYVPSFSTDVRKTIKAAQRKLMREPEMTLEFAGRRNDAALTSATKEQQK